MLEQMRKNSRHIVIYVLFGILIAAFIITFGPQSGQKTAGCLPQTSYAVKVAGQAVSEDSFRYAVMTKGGGGMSSGRQRDQRVRERAMDALIERELLAQAAEKEGFVVSATEVMDRVKLGEFYLMGEPVHGQGIYLDTDGKHFDYDKLVELAQRLGFNSLDAFLGEQKREMLAQKYRELILASVRVSPEEVLARYQREHSSVSIEYVKFEARKYKKDLVLSDADVDAYVAAHDKELKEQFERDKNLYAGGGKWVQLRQIFVASEKKAAEPPPPPAAEAQDGGPAAAAPAKPAEEMPDPAKATANAALSRIKGGEDFAQVARAVSKDERTAQRGGLEDWRRLSALGWGPEVSKAVETLELGKPSDVIDVPGGYLIVRVEAKTDGDPSYDQIKRDLGYDAAADAKTKELAKKDADEAFAKAQAGAALETLFDRGDDTPEDDADKPAEAAPAEGAPTEDKPAEATDKPADKPADAATKPGKGAKAPAPAPAAKKPAPAAPKSKIAKLLQSGPIHKSGAVVKGNGPTGYVGKSAELAKAIFEQVAVGQLAPKVFEVEDGYVIFKVLQKEEPDMPAFDKEKATLAQEMAEQKGYGLLASWNHERCVQTQAADAISVTSRFVDYGEVDEKTGKALPTSYQPCTSAGGLPPGMFPGMIPMQQ